VTSPPELFGSPTSRVIWEQVGGMVERSEGFDLKAFRLHFQVIFYMSQNLMSWGLWLYFPS
jgi:hypothetical protein